MDVRVRDDLGVALLRAQASLSVLLVEAEARDAS